MNTKTNVLALLETNKGQAISGQSIAEELNLSRNAVWKAINELRKEGYIINATTNKGYRLCKNNDILSKEGIIPFLQNKHANIIVYNTLESTNKTAKEMAISEAEHGTVIIADSQTAGRGRFGRQFHSPASCGIYMSFILHPSKLWLSTPTLITAFAAVSVCEAIELVSSKPPKIKWVNDIYLNNKKICGILTEAVTDFESGNIQWIVLGIGINFKAPPNDFPENLKQVAGSLYEETPSITRNRLIGEIINRISKLEENGSEDDVINKYKNRLMMLNEKILVIEGSKTYEAIALDVDSIGQLIIMANGNTHTLSSGEISIKQA